jgi:hypothetical protein
MQVLIHICAVLVQGSLTHASNPKDSEIGGSAQSADKPKERGEVFMAYFIDTYEL